MRFEERLARQVELLAEFYYTARDIMKENNRVLNVDFPYTTEESVSKLKRCIAKYEALRKED